MTIKLQILFPPRGKVHIVFPSLSLSSSVTALTNGKYATYSKLSPREKGSFYFLSLEILSIEVLSFCAKA